MLDWPRHHITPTSTSGFSTGIARPRWSFRRDFAAAIGSAAPSIFLRISPGGLLLTRDLFLAQASPRRGGTPHRSRQTLQDHVVAGHHRMWSESIGRACGKVIPAIAANEDKYAGRFQV